MSWEDAVHRRGGVLDDRTELLTVHDLGHGRGPVPDEAGDVLQRYAVIGHFSMAGFRNPGTQIMLSRNILRVVVALMQYALT